MIAIYQVKANHEFEGIIPSERSFDHENRRSLLGFNGESRTEAWGEKRYCYILEPNRPLGNFAAFGRNLAVRTDALNKDDQLKRFFNRHNAELLPLIDEDEGAEWYAINMVYVPNCIDLEKCIFNIRPYKRKLEFLPRRILDRKQNVFSIWRPESMRGKIFCMEENKDPRDEFKAYIEQSDMTGLEFELLWDEKNGGRTLTAKWEPSKGLVMRESPEKGPDA